MGHGRHASAVGCDSRLLLCNGSPRDSLVLGFCSLALLSWQRAAVLEKRFGWLCVIFCALAMATASHYYAVLFVIPLCIGELTRTYLLRRIDVTIWISFFGIAVPPLLFLSTITHARHYSSHFWAIPYWSKLVEFYPTYLGTSATIFLLGLLVYLIISLRLAPQSSGVHGGDAVSSSCPYMGNCDVDRNSGHTALRHGASEAGNSRIRRTICDPRPHRGRPDHFLRRFSCCPPIPDHSVSFVRDVSFFHWAAGCLAIR